MREYRGAWVATVANIDWPSAEGLSTAQQKAELVAIMERAAQLKLNAIIFQVRPGCDALYASPIEPWSEYLTGAMGRAPEPFYDPLSFAIDEAHKRGLELHAWFNPYRAQHASAKSVIAANHVSKTHPELVRQYGKYLWLDPGEKAVQDYSLSVVMDVVRRYDVDGIHFDDYFYPYKELDASGRELDFPDEASWRRFGAGGKLERDDWRRENVNTLIHRVYESIKASKPWVKFGVSPFGIWRPGNPPQIKGYDAYANLYADSRTWLANGWLDYFAPQLYWGIEPAEQSFPVLLKWWAQQNAKSRHLVAGMDSTKTVARLRGREGGTSSNGSARWESGEILNQIRLTRKEPGISGHIHWNMRSLMRNNSLDATLEGELYAQPALVPPAPWLESASPAKPQLSAQSANGSSEITWEPGKPEKVWLWLVQFRRGKEWTAEVMPAGKWGCALERPPPEVIAVTAVDRYGNASRPAVLERKP